MRTRDQHYAISVYQQVQAVKKEFPENYRQYGSMCHRLPLLIRTAGLAQALAFVKSRDKDIYKRLLEDLMITIKDTTASSGSATSSEGEGNRIVQQAIEAELNEYMRLTWQVMAALVWYKRFAQSILGVDVSDRVEGDEE
jgi:CRISPR-associated protein Cmr5